MIKVNDIYISQNGLVIFLKLDKLKIFIMYIYIFIYKVFQQKVSTKIIIKSRDFFEKRRDKFCLQRRRKIFIINSHIFG